MKGLLKQIKNMEYVSDWQQPESLRLPSQKELEEEVIPWVYTPQGINFLDRNQLTIL